MRIALIDSLNGPTVATRSGKITNSNQIYLAFVSNKCTVTAPSVVALPPAPTPITVGLPSENNLSIFNNSGLRATAFYIYITNCSLTFNHMNLFWEFQNVDPADPSILLNGTGPNYATNVGVKITLKDTSGASQTVLNKTPMVLTNAMFNSGRLMHSISLTKPTSVTDPNQITPGIFNAQATLTILYR